MRFEVFEGVKSVAILTWEEPGQVRIAARNPQDLPALAAHFGADVSDADGPSVTIRKEDWGAAQFEETALALRARGLLVAARSVPPEGRPKPGRRADR